MMIKFLFSSLLTVVLFTASTARQLALPPGVAEADLDNATEVLLISVQSVHPEEKEDSCVIYTHVFATVIGVNETGTGLMGSETVHFHSSYLVDEEDEEDHDDEMSSNNETGVAEMKQEADPCVGFTGPLSPPKLYPGWCGYVYFDVDDSGELELASYGHSFVPVEDPEAAGCPAVEDPTTTMDDQEEEDDGHGHDHEQTDHGAEDEEDHSSSTDGATSGAGQSVSLSVAMVGALVSAFWMAL
ncbi:expressed unknown protein [Seminavis robusta]|uniref:Uncharacterized protein n=1 Tax=Seminavis robusta TaxID=568900 RepID=A0A9N8DD08_9STRA|nr:expressed unknown protein [Seminavis robusta]|eukprot:Sro20_g013830.1 n/a (243) ;mRNA; r:12437-13540